jgi:ABC-type sugar transport system substrate-binding protein
VRIDRIFALLALVAVALLAAGCGDDDSSDGDGGGSDTGAASSEAPPFESIEKKIPVGYEEPSSASLRVVYLNAFGGNELLNAIGESFVAEVERLGGTAEEFDAELDPNTQISQFQQALAQDVDGIFVRSVDPGALQPVLKRAKQAGVPVITMSATDDPDDPGGFTSQIWDRRDEMAYLQVQALAESVEPGSPIGQVTTEIPAPTLQQVVEFEKKWAGEFGLEIQASVPSETDDPAGGEAAGAALLTRAQDIDGALAYNDPAGIGLAAAARQRGRTDFPVTSINGDSQGLEAVRAGRLTATVQLDAVGLGRFGAWGIYDAVAGDDLPSTVRSGELTLVTEENVDDVPTWSEAIAEEYGGGE